MKTQFRFGRAASPSGPRRGGVLIATLILVMSAGAISLCLLQVDSARLRAQVAGIDNKRAFNLAEAGLSEAYFGLTTGRTGNVGSAAAPAKFGDGLFWVEATDLGNHRVGLESTGMAGSGRATLGIVVEVEPVTIASLGVLGATTVTLGNRSSVDAFDSSDPHGLPVELAEIPVPLSSNGDIVLGTLAVIHGDATPGPQGSVTLGLGSLVTGSTRPGATALSLPTILVPEAPQQADVVHAAGSPRVLADPEASYDSIRLLPRADLTFKGPATVVVDQLTVQDGATLKVDSSEGPVQIYVTDWLNFQSGSKLAFSKDDPLGFSLLVTATGERDRDGDGLADAPILFQPASRKLYGTFYAPNAPITLPENFHLYGTTAASQLTLGNGASVHYDIALQNSAAAGGLVQLLSWRIVEIPVTIARDLSVDPFEALAVNPALLLAPAETHTDAGFLIRVEYKDLSNATHYYSGPESGFDWGQVSRVLTLKRLLP
jgi:Tfp pilus assembly protein PilX